MLPMMIVIMMVQYMYECMLLFPNTFTFVQSVFDLLRPSLIHFNLFRDFLFVYFIFRNKWVALDLLCMNDVDYCKPAHALAMRSFI